MPKDAVGDKMAKMAADLASKQGGTNRSLEGTSHSTPSDKPDGKDFTGNSAGGGGK